MLSEESCLQSCVDMLIYFGFSSQDQRSLTYIGGKKFLTNLTQEVVSIRSSSLSMTCWTTGLCQVTWALAAAHPPAQGWEVQEVPLFQSPCNSQDTFFKQQPYRKAHSHLANDWGSFPHCLKNLSKSYIQT